MILLSAETLSRKQNKLNSLGRKSFFADGCLGRKQEMADRFTEVYTMDSCGRKQKFAD